MSVTRSRLDAQTRDGVRLSIERLRGSDPHAGAVVLLHGLGANGRMFLIEGASLALYLAELGFDCFVPDLRGAGHSERPAAGFDLDTYLEQDLPTILDTALRASGQPSVSWVGLSMGGLLMFMYGIEHPDVKVQRLVTVGSALDYRLGRNVYRDLLRLRPLAGRLRVLPFDALARALAPVAGVGPALPHEAMNFNRSNVERSVCREVMRSAFSPVPIALFDSLATAFSEQGFSRAGGRIVYLPRASALRMPTLLLAGNRDPQSPPEAVAATYELLASVRDKRVVFFGKEHGQADDYGHLDLVLGKRAPTEVWPQIAAFLAATRDAAPRRADGRASAE
ncbi:MAG: alpha/beta fold hydrolase [Polyangiales bacterium]